MTITAHVSDTHSNESSVLAIDVRDGASPLAILDLVMEGMMCDTELAEFTPLTDVQHGNGRTIVWANTHGFTLTAALTA